MDLSGSAGIALTAGLLAALNPCGFALLPAYLGLLVGGSPGDAPRPGRGRAVARALRLSAAMTLGFTLVFALFGLAVAPVAGAVQQQLPRVTVVVGLLLVGTGALLLAGREVRLPRRRGRAGTPRPLTAGTGTMVAFGASYATASLTCTVAPFLAVVVAAFRADAVIDGIALFLLYAAGMGSVVGTLAVAVALSEESLVTRLRRASRYVPRVAGALLLLSGAYVAYYGWWELRVLGGAPPSDPVVDRALAVQAWLAGLVDAAGVGGVVLAGLLLTGLAVGVPALRARRRRSPADHPPTSSTLPG